MFRLSLHAIHTACGIETPEAVRVKLKVHALHAIHTACGIETRRVLAFGRLEELLHAIHTACGIETDKGISTRVIFSHCMQSIPLAVLKHWRVFVAVAEIQP